MRLTRSDGQIQHLSYCSNIHPGESWDEVRRNLETHLPRVREHMGESGEFGIGLRLSAAAASELSAPAALDEFRQFLKDNGLYVFTINAFPYGPFHGTRVKEDVYLPDWLDEERLRYSNEAATLLSELLPPDCQGSVSTVPGAFKSSIRNRQDVERMAQLMVSHVAHLLALKARTQRHIVLALEPEPCCFLETIEETIDFFDNALFSERSVTQLATASHLDPRAAEQALRSHLSVCLDLCHAAVEFEDHRACVRALRRSGIRIGKLQISAGLRLDEVDATSRTLLDPFADDVYLHQVVQRQGQQLERFADLPDAFAGLAAERSTATGGQAATASSSSDRREWRVHFHVPVFLKELGAFSSTQDYVEQALADHRKEAISDHLEVETYTWSVLPEALRTVSIDEAIARELDWVRKRL